MLRQILEFRLAVLVVDFPDAVEHHFVPLVRRVLGPQRLGQMWNLAMMPGDQHHLAGVFRLGEQRVGELFVLVVLELIVDLLPQAPRPAE